MKSVCVIGAGICGLSSAVIIKEKFNEFKVTVVSETFSPNTTSDGAAGLWFPIFVGNTSIKNIEKWGIETYKLFQQLWKNGLDGIILIPMFCGYRDANQQISIPMWSKSVHGFHMLSRNQLNFWDNNYNTGFHFVTFIAEPTSILNYLMKRFKEVGGLLKHHRIHSLDDDILKQFDYIINCTGLKASSIVPDENVFPIRGQILRVQAPWIHDVNIDLSITGTYIIPNVNTCVLGGTHQDNDWNVELDINDRNFILNGCYKMLPGLKHAEVKKEWVGLRPGRCEVRLEIDNTRRNVIHNYGHGGSGVTLFWGCAMEVCQLLSSSIVGKSKL